MQLSKETLSIFKNFSGINSNLILRAGNKLATMAVASNIIADAAVAEEFPIDFGIYDLNEFLGVLSLFDSPELTFTDKYVTIKEGRNAIRYFAANIANLTRVPTLKQFPDAEVEFDMPAQMLSQIQRVSSILKVSDFSIVGDGSNIAINVGDKKNPSGNTFESEIGVTDKTFKINLKVENLRMMPGDYKVSIGRNGAKMISRFKSANQDLTYYVATELDSTFDS